MEKKKLQRRCIALATAAALLVTGGAGMQTGSLQNVKAASGATELVIDGSTTDKEVQNAYRGLGTVTCNNSSRLLIDYKEEQPDKYWEIMNWLFHPEKGAGLSHVKIELGCDSNTSSGAEPATKRSSKDPANVNRGAGFLFAHDALTINPNITIDMLCWGMPGWVQEAYDTSQKAGYKARYRWYKETIDAAYDVWGIRFSHVSANRNEKPVEKGWTVHLSEALKAETKGRYDYGQIKIVAADETDTMDVAAQMLKNKKYRNAVDVIGCHYNSYMDKKIMKLNKEYKKEIWFSEGASIATDTIFGSNNTVDGVSTSGANGMLDIANRIIIAFAQSNMTMYQFQPSVASYYDGSVYYPKQLLSANHPWSGYYEVTAGMVMAMHFNSFLKKGWQYVDSGSYGDGTQSNHMITDTKNNYLTAADPSTGDYSTVITNDSSTPRVYQVKVSNLAAAASPVTVWETRSNTPGESYDAGWLTQRQTIAPVLENGIYTYQVTVAPYSMISLTTTTGQQSYAQKKEGTHANDNSIGKGLGLPYTDNFEYSEEFIQRRGGTPKYTTDQDGAFEVVILPDGSKVLMQQIDQDSLPSAWGGKNNNPVTSLGDDTWKDYSVSVDAKLDEHSNKNSNYVGVCARYNCSEDIADNGYWLKVYRSGKWILSANTGKLASGTLPEIKEGRWMTLKVTVKDNTVTAFINGRKMVEKKVTSSWSNSGRVALGSGYANNYYDNIRVTPISGGITHIKRADDLDSSITATGKVVREQSLSYVNYGRTLSTLKKKGDSLSYQFTGTGISLLGKNYAGTKLNIVVDGATVKSNYAIKDTDNRAAFYQLSGLTNGQHTIQIILANQEEISLDAVEVAEEIWQDTGVKADGITFGAVKTELAYGEVLDLQPVLSGAGSTDEIKYTTSDASVAVATSDGKIHGNGGGNATITAETENGSKADYKVSVTELSVKPANGIRLGVGEKITLKASFVKGMNKAKITEWISESSVASVSSKGKVTAKKPGKVTVTAKAENGYCRSVSITVKKAPAKISLAKKLTLKAGKTKQLKYKLPAGSYTNSVTYRSNRKKVAVVSAKGFIKAKKKGKAIITAVTHNGKKAKLRLTVTNGKKKQK